MTKKTKKTAAKTPVEIDEEDLDKAAGGATFTERSINFTSSTGTLLPAVKPASAVEDGSLNFTRK